MTGTLSLFDVPGEMHRAAQISRDGRYRYTLERRWSTAPAVLFIMLNPSTADATRDDPTIRRCIAFAKEWGYGQLLVGNLYAYRATDPRDLPRDETAIGPDNDEHLATMRARADMVVAAWGAHPHADGRIAAVLRHLAVRPHVLGLTKGGYPRHPLYIRADVRPWQP